ncbi:MAG: TetR/AcrR family transcriptional regulator [Nocardioides sp.]|uniref:TetR/AcrR family transcriptional regulator n=1 Tax=Nocardioides sp. TaxID=35761 RepID=UPI0039E59CD3
MPRPKTDTREKLLAATLDYVATHGVGELSLRQLAAGIGTTHRVLLFHFGTKESLLAEVVSAVERQQQQFVEDLSAASSQSAAEQIRVVWRRVSDPALAPYVRLFFELAGHALQGREHTGGLRESLVGLWLEPLPAMLRRGGVPKQTAQQDARIVLATVRGLLLDLLATGDRDAVDRSMERFLQCWEIAWTTRAPRKASARRS